MSKIHRITSFSDPCYENFHHIYTLSFPVFERRSKEQQEYAFGSDRYFLECGMENNNILYFIAYWEYEDYIYIEHFAVNPDLRGMNIGTTALQQFLREKQKPVLLEIDPLTNEMAVKRYRFYQKLGFVDNDYPHFHPPYNERFPAHELVVLSFAQPLQNSLYEKFYRDLSQEVMRNGDPCTRLSGAPNE